MTNPTADTVAEFNRGVVGLLKQASTADVMKAFHQMHEAATGPGALAGDVKELVAIAIAIATHCEGCIAWHVTNAVRAGASREQVLETIGVAVMMGGGPAVWYGSKAAKALDDITD